MANEMVNRTGSLSLTPDEIKKAGTVTATTDMLELTNTGNAASMTATGTAILFNQYYYDATTPAEADAGRILVKTEGNWTSTASSQDATMAFQLALNGTVGDKMTIGSDGTVTATTFVGAVTGAATQITLADESSDTSCYPVFATDATGDRAPKTDASSLSYNATTGVLSAVGFTPSGFNTRHTIYVDGGRTDTYTATGTYLQPYTTLKAAIDWVNTDAAAHITASDMVNAQYVIYVAQGTYSDNITINNPRYLGIHLNGADISGSITMTTTEQSEIPGGSGNHYCRTEFIGGCGNRAEKGARGRISGAMSCARNNDSLYYLHFSGMDLTNDIDFPTAGTWIVSFQNCAHRATAKTISGTFASSATSFAYIETYGQNEFLCSWSGDIVFADCKGTTFKNINTTPHSADHRFVDCQFSGTITMNSATAKVIYCDSQSYVSFAGRTPTLTNLTYSVIDSTTATPVDDAADTSCFVPFLNAATGVGVIKSNTSFTFNAATAALGVKYLALTNQAGAAQDRALLLGQGTAADPATWSTADKSAVEFRLKSTATSGTAYGIYIGMEGAADSEHIPVRGRVLTTAATGNAHGGHFTLESDGTNGKVTGLGTGMRANWVLGGAAEEAGGTYYGAMAEIYATASGDPSAVTRYACLAVGVGGDATAAAKCKNAIDFYSAGADATTNMIYSHSHAPGDAAGSIRVLVNGVARYLKFWAAE